LVILLLRALLLYKLPKKTFVALWWVALARLLLPFELPSAFSVYSLLGLGQASAAAQAGETLLLQSGAATQAGGTAQALVLISSLSAASGGTSQTAQAAAAAETAGRATVSLPLWGIVWCVGLAVGLAVFAVCYARNLREFRTSLPVERAQVAAWQHRHPLRRRLQIRQSDRVAGPLTYGVLRPVILLPKDTAWEDERQTECVLLHEYEHIRHWDALAKLLMAVALCVHWFDPLVWVMWVLFNRDLELACDEAVLRRMGSDCRVQYATMLLDRMETQARQVTPLCSAFGDKAGRAEKERIVAIMKTKKSTVLAAVCAGLLVCAVAVGFATGAKPQDETGKSASTASESVQIQTVAQKSGKLSWNYTDETYPTFLAQDAKRLELENTTGIDFSTMTLDEVKQALKTLMGRLKNPFGSFNHNGTVYTSDSAVWYSTLKPYVMYGLSVEIGEQCHMEYQGKTVIALCDFAPTQYGHSSGVTRYVGVVTDDTTEGVVLYVDYDANGRCVGLREATEDELLMWTYLDAEEVFFYAVSDDAALTEQA
jgi:beta-lactamase regulating signal transducer with metallopeptidase domain